MALVDESKFVPEGMRGLNCGMCRIRGMRKLRSLRVRFFGLLVSDGGFSSERIGRGEVSRGEIHRQYG